MYILITLSYILMGLALVCMLSGISIWFYTKNDRHIELGLASAMGSMVLAIVIGGVGWLRVYGII
jgi:hypothetical protein